MKLPSASGGGLAPSGNSAALTYPGVFGSRTGGAERVWAGAGVAAATRLIHKVRRNSVEFTVSNKVCGYFGAAMG